MNEENQTNGSESYQPTEHEIIRTMEEYGGSFAKALASAYMVADVYNQTKIRVAWPEMWSQYERMATQVHERDSQ